MPKVMGYAQGRKNTKKQIYIKNKQDYKILVFRVSCSG